MGDNNRNHRNTRKEGEVVSMRCRHCGKWIARDDVRHAVDHLADVHRELERAGLSELEAHLEVLELQRALERRVMSA